MFRTNLPNWAGPATRSDSANGLSSGRPVKCRLPARRMQVSPASGEYFISVPPPEFAFGLISRQSARHSIGEESRGGAIVARYFALWREWARGVRTPARRP